MISVVFDIFKRGLLGTLIEEFANLKLNWL